mgnify:CR=1 FL=1
MIFHRKKYGVNTLLPLLSILLLLSSCASREELVYFQGPPPNLDSIHHAPPTLQPDDLLAITVSAADLEATLPFNQVSPYTARAGSGQNQDRQITYLIDEQGYIDYPVLGRIKLGGLTRAQAMDMMRRLLSEYIIDPGVNIHITNFRVTVIGEVRNPGSFTLPEERVTVLEALGLAGDLTINGVRNNVLVIRHTEGEKSFYRLDLTSNDIIQSPAYFLRQNDVIYVEPNKAQINSSTYSRNTSVVISIASLAITVLSILFRK